MIATPALAVLLLLVLAASSSTAADTNPAAECAAELRTMSSCVPYLAPTRRHGRRYHCHHPSAACCKAFSVAAFGDGGGGIGCLCNLVSNSSPLGFPVNVSRIVNLCASCNGVRAAAAIAAPLTSICLAQSEALPSCSITPYVTPTAPTASPAQAEYVNPVVPATGLPEAPPAAPAISDTDHGNGSIPAKPEPSVAVSVEIWCALVLLLVEILLYYYLEERDPLAFGIAGLLLGVLMFFMLALAPSSETGNH